MYSTGVFECDKMNEFHLQGNIIPQAWYKTIVKKDLKEPKPHLLAILILADIVYWYRPVEVRDEITGELLGYRKKFRSDLLQRSYEDLSAMFGYSASCIKEAVVFLEKLGLISRVFRDQIIGGIKCNNVMFISLDIIRLKELTYPSDDIQTEGVTESRRRGVQIKTEGPAEFRRTNTENTTKNTSYTTPSIYHENIDREIDGVKDIVEEELDVNEAIPLEYYDCPPKMDAAIRILTDYDIRSTASDDFDRETYKLFSDCLGEMCTEKYPRAYHGRKVESGVKFIEKINYCLLQEGDLYTFVEWALNDFKEAAKRKEIKNTRAYMKSVICTALFDFKIKNEALLSRLS